MKNTLADCEGFQWDEGNSDKNWYLHQVTNGECEEVFFNQPFVLAFDRRHSVEERRCYALGRTDRDRWLFVSFMVRANLIRVISARDMNRKEAQKYAEKIKDATDLQD